jgi:DNA-binding transcriptional LysR family regulator
MDEVEKLLIEHTEPEGTITLCSISGIGTYILPYWIEQFRQLHPGITIMVKTDRSRPIIDQVLKGGIDMGLVSGPVSHNGLVSSPICSEKNRSCCLSTASLGNKIFGTCKRI